MAIVKMQHVSVIGMNDEKQDLLKDLMDLGIVEVSSGADKLQDEDWNRLVTRDGDEKGVSENEKKLSDIQSAIDVLMKTGEIKSPLFSVRKSISSEDNKAKLSREDAYEKETKEVLDLDRQLTDAYTEANNAQTQIYALTPWKSYDVPLEIKETERLSVRLGVFPPLADLSAAAEEVAGEGYEIELSELGRDQQQCYASLMFFKEDEEKVLEILKKHGYSNSNLGEFKGTVSENIDSLTKEIEEAGARREKVTEEIKSKAEYLDDLKYYHDLIQTRLAKARVRDKLLNTDKTFTFDGWVPTAAETALSKTLDKYTCAYEYKEPAEDDDDIPVKLKNKSFFAPLEFVTKLYSLPNPHEVDPTPIFTLFYILFFGIMFGDVGYGLIIIIATGILLKKNMVEGSAKKLIQLLFYSGFSSVIWGVLFGSYFGDAITVIGKTFFGKSIVIKPLWLDPSKQAMLFLAFSCGLGVIHLFVGMGIDAYEKIRSGNALAAVNDDVIWYAIVLGAIMLLFGKRLGPGVPVAGKWMLIIGLALAVILPIFMSKGVGKALGLWNIYSGLTGQLSDILSYSRLLGLGLASTSIAQVFNFLAAMGGKSVAGVIMFIVIFLLGHTLNFAINALGAFVHSCRLQFVEFFGKFYEGGGREFDPFERDTKYVKIIEEDK